MNNNEQKKHEYVGHGWHVQNSEEAVRISIYPDNFEKIIEELNRCSELNKPASFLIDRKRNPTGKTTHYMKMFLTDVNSEQKTEPASMEQHKYTRDDRPPAPAQSAPADYQMPPIPEAPADDEIPF